MTRPTTEIDNARNGYWNSNPVSAENPGGLDESADGTLAGHVENFPAAVQAVGKMTQWVGDQMDTLDAAVTTTTTNAATSTTAAGTATTKAGEAAASATTASTAATTATTAAGTATTKAGEAAASATTASTAATTATGAAGTATTKAGEAAASATTASTAATTATAAAGTATTKAGEATTAAATAVAAVANTNSVWCGSATGTATALVLSPATALPAYGAGITLRWVAAYAAGGATTVNVSGLGARALKTASGAPIVSGMWAAGEVLSATDTGSELRLAAAGLPAASTATTVAGTSASEAVVPASLAAWLPGLTEVSSVDAEADRLLIYSAAAAAPRKIRPSLMGFISGTSARYWRLRATADSYKTDNGVRFMIIDDIWLYSGTTGGTPLTVAAAAASSTGAGSAAGAWDGSASTGWQSANSPATYQWLSADFGTAVVVRALKIKPYGYSGSAATYIASQMVLEASANNTDWTLVATIAPSDAGTAAQYFNGLQ